MSAPVEKAPCPDCSEQHEQPRLRVVQIDVNTALAVAAALLLFGFLLGVNVGRANTLASLQP